MAAERKINLSGGMQLKLFKTSFMLSESAALAFLGFDIDTIPEDVWKALGAMFVSAYEKGCQDQRMVIRDKHKEFLNSFKQGGE